MSTCTRPQTHTTSDALHLGCSRDSVGKNIEGDSDTVRSSSCLRLIGSVITANSKQPTCRNSDASVSSTPKPSTGHTGDSGRPQMPPQGMMMHSPYSNSHKQGPANMTTRPKNMDPSAYRLCQEALAFPAASDFEDDSKPPKKRKKCCFASSLRQRWSHSSLYALDDAPMVTLEHQFAQTTLQPTPL